MYPFVRFFVVPGKNKTMELSTLLLNMMTQQITYHDDYDEVYLRKTIAKT